MTFDVSKARRWLAGSSLRSARPLLREAIDEIERLKGEQARDLADVERFRGMARQYMDERDATIQLRGKTLLERDDAYCRISDLKAENALLRRVAEAAQTSRWSCEDSELVDALEALASSQPQQRERGDGDAD